MTNPLDEQRAAHVEVLRNLQDAADRDECFNISATLGALMERTAPPLCAKGATRLGRHMTGRMIEGNLEADTITFQMDRGYYLAAGAYVIEPRDDWEARTTPAQPRREVTDDPRVAELIAAAEGAEALIGVMFGSVHGRYPETIDTPLGVPVKVGKIAASLRAALESFANGGDGNG